MRTARLALTSLWWSQVVRIMADNALRIYVVLLAASAAGAAAAADAADAAWGLAAALYILPALLLAPMNGALSNSLPKRRVLIGSAAFCLVAAIVFSLLNAWYSWPGGWLWCLALAAVGNAVYSPTRYGMLPAAAHDTHWPLTRINGWIEMGSGVAIIAGCMLGGRLFETPSPIDPAWPALVLGILTLYALALLTAIPVFFPSDVYRAESPALAVLGFFRDCKRIFRARETRGYLLAIAAFRGVGLGLVGPMIGIYIDRAPGSTALDHVRTLVFAAGFVGIGAAVGSMLAGLQWHPTRILGMVPFATLGFAAGLALAAILQGIPWWLCVWIGAMAGIINVPLFTAYQAGLPADARGNGMAVLNAAGYFCMTLATFAMQLLARNHVLQPASRLWIIVTLAGIGFLLALWYLRRDAWEQALELPFRIMYRIRGVGPGIEEIPLEGPLLVVANHSAYLDPVWLASVLPRRLTGMLTSVIFDKPIMRFLGTHVVPVIRVEQRYRREAPELEVAIAALDRGEAVLIFPEGQLRKTEEFHLRQFGRGVWHILKERPQTPVLVCWIEGGWGSFLSYYHGKPAQNKRVDFRRPIGVGARAPEVLSAELLADHRATRNYLMAACADARRLLGLEPGPLKDMNVPEPALAKEGEDE